MGPAQSPVWLAKELGSEPSVYTPTTGLSCLGGALLPGLPPAAFLFPPLISQLPAPPPPPGALNLSIASSPPFYDMMVVGSDENVRGLRHQKDVGGSAPPSHV